MNLGKAAAVYAMYNADPGGPTSTITNTSATARVTATIDCVANGAIAASAFLQSGGSGVTNAAWTNLTKGVDINVLNNANRGSMAADAFATEHASLGCTVTGTGASAVGNCIIACAYQPLQ